MALFKINRGNSATLPSAMTDGWAYFCTDTGEFFIDYADENGELHRKQINAEEAKKLTGYDIKTILNDSEVEIPTSKAILDALNLKQDVITGAEGQYVGFDSDGNTAAFDLPSEVIISDTEPTDETAEIWINTSEEWNDNIPEQVQADLNQTDESAPDYVKGTVDHTRLPEGYPYKEQSWTVLAENVSVTTNDSGDYALGWLDEAFSSYLFNVGYDDFEYWPGLVCKVIFDGAEYVCEIKKHIGAMNPTCLGNAGLHAEYGFEDTGEPFCFWVDSGAEAFGTKTAGTHTFSVYLQSETIHPMAPEFLPAGVGGGEQNAYIITATPEGSGFVCSHTYDEIMELVNNNFFVVMKINFYGTPAYFNMVYALNGEACFSGFVKMYGSGNLNVYDAYVSTDGVHLEGNPVVLAGLVLSDADNKQYKISVVDGSLTATAL